jgi:ATP phosphoribosyltransferase regulatory subunit
MKPNASQKSLSRIPAGVAYFFGSEVSLRREIERQTRDVFSGWSYKEILLPVYDYYEMFARGGGDGRLDAPFCFTDAEGGLLALRPDLTSLVARTVATRFGGEARPIRLCYAGEVFRNFQSGGRTPFESWQIGAEIFGNDRLEADVEVLLVAIEALQRLGVGDFQISLGHAGFLAGVIEELGIDAASAAELRDAVDSRNRERLARRLAECAGSAAAQFTEFFHLTGGGDALKRARAQTANAVVHAALDDLEHLMDVARTLKIEPFLTADFGDVSALDYYTGMTFKIYSPGVGAEVASGGRYDALLRSFGADEPAVGFQFNVDRLVRLLRRSIGERRQDEPPTILEADRDDLTVAFQQAQALRLLGKRVEIRTARHSFAPETPPAPKEITE